MLASLRALEAPATTTDMTHADNEIPVTVDQLAHRAARSSRVSVTPFAHRESDRDDVIAMLIEGSHDPEVREKNYLPPCMDVPRAREYLATSDGVVLCLDARPVGVAVALHSPSPGDGVEIPPGSVELDMWVLAPFRGQGMRWFPLMAGWFAQRFDNLVGVTWADNHTAIALLRWSGWTHLGRSLWSEGGCSGACEVFLYDLAAFRQRQRKDPTDAAP